MHIRSYRVVFAGLALIATLAGPAAAASADTLVQPSTTSVDYDQYGRQIGTSVTTPSVIYLDGSTHNDVPTTTTHYDTSGNRVGTSVNTPSVIYLGD